MTRSPDPEPPHTAAVPVPGQRAAARQIDPPGHLDPLEQADPYAVADAAATENLLRCWIREAGVGPAFGDEFFIPLPASGTALRVPVRHWSAVGSHRFAAPPFLDGAPADAPHLDAVTLAALLAREAAGAPADGADLVLRVADSVRRTAVFLRERRNAPADQPGVPAFLAAEQSLVLGHPLHPAPKSREGLTDTEADVYSPELRGAFALHWMAVDCSVVAADSAWTVRGRAIPADQLTAELLGDEAVLPEGTVALPLHPWQARELRHRLQVRRLFDAGLLHDLGERGDAWHPTSSLRTVYRPGAPAMLKLSLALPITNSRRENLRKELLRGAEVHRLLRTGLSDEWRAVHPGFDIVRDPAWLAVDTPEGEPVPGFDVVLRHPTFGADDDINCLAGLTALRPSTRGLAPSADCTMAQQAPYLLRSRLADLVDGLVARTGRCAATVSTEWFLRYLDAVVLPMLWLDGEAGIALEAHQQNTLVHLDADGWPIGGRYRDNQGYCFREPYRAALEGRVPGIGADSDTFVSDEVADERFAYYLGINNVLGLIGAFGSQGLVDERVLLAAFRRFLGKAATNGRSPLPAYLLDHPTLRCKANLLTRLHGLDELIGPVDTQPIYVTIPNPLAAPAA
jgi:siderophore synthetase component